MMTITINTFEEIHHVCLMYGLKMAYQRFPFLADNIMATPPPFRRNPRSRSVFIGRGPVCVQYFQKEMMVRYDEKRVTPEEISAFSKAIVEEYMRLRHPYMRRIWTDSRLTEQASGHLIAEII